MSSYQYFMVSRGGLAGRLKSGQQRATPELFRYQFDPGLVDKNPKRRARGQRARGQERAGSKRAGSGLVLPISVPALARNPAHRRPGHPTPYAGIAFKTRPDPKPVFSNISHPKAAGFSARVAVILGGTIRLLTIAVLSRSTPRSMTIWLARYAATSASLSQSCYK